MKIDKSRHHVKDQGYEDLSEWFLESFWRQYKVKKVHFKFLGVSRRKYDRKREKNTRICTSRTVQGMTHPWLGMYTP